MVFLPKGLMCVLILHSLPWVTTGDGDRGVIPLDTTPAPPEVSEPTVQLLQITKRRRKARRRMKQRTGGSALIISTVFNSFP